MSTWTERIPTAFPKELILEANQLAAIIDPDTGGAFTFTEESIRSDYVYAEIPLMSHFEPVVRERDAETWQTVIAQLADAKGVERLSEEVVETLRTALLFGAEETAILSTNENFIPQ